jgi:hypothetical protein
MTHYIVDATLWIGFTVTTIVAAILLVVEKRLKKRTRTFLQTTNEDLVRIHTKYTQIESLIGSCRVTFNKTETEGQKNYAFEFAGIEELREKLSTYRGYSTVMIFPDMDAVRHWAGTQEEDLSYFNKTINELRNEGIHTDNQRQN